MLGEIRRTKIESSARRRRRRKDGLARQIMSLVQTRDYHFSGLRNRSKRATTTCYSGAPVSSKNKKMGKQAVLSIEQNLCTTNSMLMRTKQVPMPPDCCLRAHYKGQEQDFRLDYKGTINLDISSPLRSHAAIGKQLESRQKEEDYSSLLEVDNTKTWRQTDDNYNQTIASLACNKVSKGRSLASNRNRRFNSVLNNLERISTLPVLSCNWALVLHYVAIILFSQHFICKWLERVDCALSVGEYPYQLLNNTKIILPKQFLDSSNSTDLVDNDDDGDIKGINNTKTNGYLSPKSVLERRNFGKRIHQKSGQVDTILARTIRQLNALNIPHENYTQQVNNSLANSQIYDTIKRDYDTICLNDLPDSKSTSADYQRNTTNRNASYLPTSNITSIRSRDFRPGGWNSLAGNQLNLSHSIGVTSDSLSEESERQYIIRDQDETGQLASHQTPGRGANWTEAAQESLSIGIVIRPGEEQSSEDVLQDNSHLESATDYQVVGLDGNKSHLLPVNERDRLRVLSATQPIQLNDKVWNNSASEPDWQASDIEQVIKVKKEDGEESDGEKSGAQEELKKGKSEQNVHGERLKDKEEKAHWKKEKHGEEQRSGSGKKDAAAEAKWLKDMGHNKHGWKNVYHKEEYANHQKYHDVLRDKNWDNQKAKAEENHHFEKGNKFKDVQRKDYYDKDKHGNKYDFSKGNEWKRQEDEHYDGGADNHMKELDGSTQFGQKAASAEKDTDWDFPERDHQKVVEASIQNSVHRNGNHDHTPASAAVAANTAGNEDPFAGRPDSGGAPEEDEDVIEQMKDKLDRLSQAQSMSDTEKRYKTSQSNPVHEHRLPNAEQRFPTNSQQGGSDEGSSADADNDNDSPDYDNDWNEPANRAATLAASVNNRSTTSGLPNSTYQSINDILKTAKQAGQQVQRNTMSMPEQQLQQRHRNSGGQQQVKSVQPNSASYSNTNDDEDSENEPDSDNKTQRKDNRKNQLRLKLELDLSKSLARPKLNKRNQTTTGNVATASTNKGHAALIAKNKIQPDRGSIRLPIQAGLNSGWLPKDTMREVQSGKHPDSYDGRLEAGSWRNGASSRYPSEHERIVGQDKRQYLTMASLQGVLRDHQSGKQFLNQTPDSIDPPGSWQSTQQFQHQHPQRQSALAAGQSNLRHSQRGQANLDEVISLAQVIPSRSIMAKQPQLNAASSNRSSLVGLRQVAPLRHPISPHPLTSIEPINPPSGFQTGSLMGEDLTIETSLASALADNVLTLSHLHNPNPLSPMQADAIDNLIRQQQAAAAKQAISNEESNKDYMMLFGNHPVGTSAQVHHHQQQPQRFAESHHAIDGEPNVIFETSASTMDEERQPYMSDSYQHQHQQQVNNILLNMIRDEEQQLGTQSLRNSIRHPLASSIVNQAFNQYQQQAKPLRARPTMVTSLRDTRKIPNLLKLASVNYTLLGGAGKGTSSSFGAPSMQQALGRFLRLPRVFRPSAQSSSPVNQHPLQGDESRPQFINTDWGSLAPVGGHFKPFGGMSTMAVAHQQQQYLADSASLAFDPLLEAASSTKQSQMTLIPHKTAAANLSLQVTQAFDPKLFYGNNNSGVIKVLGDDDKEREVTKEQSESGASKKGLAKNLLRKKKKFKRKPHSNSNHMTDEVKPVRFESNMAHNFASFNTNPQLDALEPDEESISSAPIWGARNNKSPLSSLGNGVRSNATLLTAPSTSMVAALDVDAMPSRPIPIRSNSLNSQQINWINQANSAWNSQQELEGDPYSGGINNKLHVHKIPQQFTEPSHLKTAQQVPAFMVTIAQPPTSTKEPHFGQRVFRNFKNKLSISGRTSG